MFRNFRSLPLDVPSNRILAQKAEFVNNYPEKQGKSGKVVIRIS